MPVWCILHNRVYTDSVKTDVEFSFVEIDQPDDDETNKVELYVYPRFSEAMKKSKEGIAQEDDTTKHARRCLTRQLRQTPKGLIVFFRGVFYFLDVAGLVQDTKNRPFDSYLSVPFRYSRECKAQCFSCVNLDGVVVRTLVQLALHSKSNAIVRGEAQKIRNETSSDKMLTARQIDHFVQPLFLGLDKPPASIELKDCVVFICHPTKNNNETLDIRMALVGVRIDKTLCISQVFISNKEAECTLWLPGIRQQLEDYCADWDLKCDIQFSEYQVPIPGTSTLVTQDYTKHTHAEIKKATQQLVLNQ
jgi:hypothetical protein